MNRAAICAGKAAENNMNKTTTKRMGKWRAIHLRRLVCYVYTKEPMCVPALYPTISGGIYPFEYRSQCHIYGVWNIIANFTSCYTGSSAHPSS